MPKQLSTNEVAAYHDRGFHFPIDALNSSEVAEFRRKLEDYEARRRPDQGRDAPSQPCAVHLDR